MLHRGAVAPQQHGQGDLRDAQQGTALGIPHGDVHVRYLAIIIERVREALLQVGGVHQVARFDPDLGLVEPPIGTHILPGLEPRRLQLPATAPAVKRVGYAGRAPPGLQPVQELHIGWATRLGAIRRAPFLPIVIIRIPTGARSTRVHCDYPRCRRPWEGEEGEREEDTPRRRLLQPVLRPLRRGRPT